MATEGSEIFLLYNEQEESVDSVVSELRHRGAQLYFYRDDLPAGSNIREMEATRLRNAKVVVVLLGEMGWGITQANLGQQAVALEKPIIPVLIGNPPERALEQVGALFLTRRRLDLRARTPALFDELARAIEQITTTNQSPETPREAAIDGLDEIINILVDGSDIERSHLIRRIVQYPAAKQAALATRLRSAIVEDFAPEHESHFATAKRTPKQLAPTRSWMLSALIQLEPSGGDSQRVILDHISTKIEPDREVRFWTLAGVVQRKLTYLSDALDIAKLDPEREISGLAAIVLEPDNQATLQEFRESLRSESFGTPWHVLRILRIVPVPALAADVVEQISRHAEGKPLAYDVLFALANPEMAHVAKPHILKYLGLDRLIKLIVQEARSATEIARAAFARILLVFEEAEVSSALQRASESPSDRQLVRKISDYTSEFRNTEDSSPPPIAGFSSDVNDVAQDAIGISKDVSTLASIILSRNVKPPLAIGLFGEWGSGKSFFMNSIEADCRRIVAKSQLQHGSLFCTDIVQINFNAWHYADTNLWASLVSHILDELSKHLVPVPSADEKQATLVGELANAQIEVAAAQAEKERANLRLEETARALQNKIVERERRELRLRDLRAGDLTALLAGDHELATTIEDALKSIGAPAAFESISELNKVVEESYSTAGRATAFVVALFSGRNVAISLAGIAAIIGLPPLIAAGAEQFLGAAASSVAEVLAKVTTIAGSLTVVVQATIRKVRSGLDALSRAKRVVDERLAKRRETPGQDEKRLEAELQEAKVGEQTAINRVSVARARAQDLEDRVALLKESQSLGYFVAERSKSDDYRRHLGLISTIRKDFNNLVDRLKAKGAQQGRRVDRIVLYVDDVDRCPPQLVVDILQAVHLLLAYELFVVVVSVDPRWLLRSLESSFTIFQREGNLETWDATPQDYLEKIFQIPFSVRPMGDKGFGRLIQRLFQPSSEVAAQPASNEFAVAHVAQETPKTTPSPDAPSFINPGVIDLPQTPQDNSATGQTDQSAAPDIEELAEALAITVAETEFAQTLHGFLPTPRQAKRFANIYRVMKACLRRNRLARFEGSQGVAGEFQLPMLLLALLVGHSRAARVLFPEFLARAREEHVDWWSPAEPGNIKHADLRELLRGILSAPLFPSDASLLVEWLPQVARYSFSTAKMFLDTQERPTG